VQKQLTAYHGRKFSVTVAGEASDNVFCTGKGVGGGEKVGRKDEGNKTLQRKMTMKCGLSGHKKGGKREGTCGNQVEGERYS